MTAMYQIEVKRYLVEYQFPVHDGWKVTIDLDAMELGKGGHQNADKLTVAESCHRWFKENNVVLGSHPHYDRVDLIAENNSIGTYVIEVEGDSKRQREQAIYSALGQTILLMNEASNSVRYGVAVPDSPRWKFQLQKIPKRVRKILKLDLFLVSKEGVRKLGSF